MSFNFSTQFNFFLSAVISNLLFENEKMEDLL